MSKKGWILSAVAAVLVAGAIIFFFLSHGTAPVTYRTTPVTRGDVKVQVTATGTVNPHFNVQVGTQVSGTVAKLFADYNSHVKKGQVVALLDPTLLTAAVQDARATLAKADAQMLLTKQTSSRTRVLFGKGLVAQADLDQAIADSAAAAAALSSAQAGLNRAKINLGYATIVSPITGVVIARNVDVGQTVAASFNTPTLFTVSDDLTKMQVQASIDEADVGQIKVGQNATFTVDAYPSRSFKGIVSQIRLSPTTVQNVVSYTVMIDLDNNDLALLPGMTANVTIDVQKAENVLVVPAAALKFVPPFAMAGAGKRHRPGGDSAAGHGQWIKRDSAAGGQDAQGAQGAPAGRGQWAKRDTTGGHGQWKKPDSSQGRIWVLKDGKPVRVPVRLGLSNGGFTAVEGDVQPGDPVIVGSVSNDKNKPAASTLPIGGPGGMGRRF